MRSVSRVVLCLILFLVACAEEREPINRVQPNVVDKSWFTDDWYYLQTVIDTPYSTGFTFVGEQNYAERIRWEIQEDYLIARRTYEWIAGAEPEGLAGATEEGAAVAMWRIDSHFDIRRDYNPTTGEEINVVLENDTDRPWYERSFMRVDWSENLIEDADALAWARVLEGIEARSVAYYVQDLEEGNPHRPKFVHDPLTGEVNYIDLVSKIFIEPTTIWDEWWGEIPTCWLASQLYLDCVGSEITIRHSFLRVDDEGRDYQPWDYSGDRMERFGYFVTERAGYDPDYGVVDPVRHRLINRHNLWQASYRRDEAGERIPCTVDEECGEVSGSVCDLNYAHAWRTPEGRCTIPYRERQVRPIVYFASKNLPSDFFNDLEHFRQEWNNAFRLTVDSLREQECLTQGGSEADCAQERGREDGESCLVFCHNPVTAEDHEACGPEGTVAEIGDLRHSLIGYVSDAHVAPPLGYGPSAVDPVTGEHIQGSAFIYGPEVEWYASYARDLVALLNGDLSPEEVMSGLNVQRVAEQLGRVDRGRSERTAHDHVIPLDGQDAERVSRSMDFSWAQIPNGARPEGSRRRPSNLREAREMREAARRRIADQGGFGHGAEGGQARLTQLQGTPLEAMMTSPEMRIASGLDPRAPLDESSLEAASPLRGNGLAGRRALRDSERRLQGPRCQIRAEFMDEGLLGLAREVQRTVARGDGTMEWYGVSYQLRGDDGEIDYDAVRDMLRHPVFEAATSHELGHTLGLRHNFMASYDSLNYHPEYWQLRDDGDMHPRAWDPITEEEIDGRIREYQTSSVMDYGNNFVSTDAMGLGYYDFAAIKMGYGDLIEVFTDAPDPHEAAWINAMTIYQWPVILHEDAFEGGEARAYEYTEIPEVLGGIDRISQRADVPYSSLQPEARLLRDDIDLPLVDAQGRPAVPYYFCSDEVSDIDPTCMLYDAGADPYETIQSVIDSYWYYYIFSNFRRERLEFDVEPYYWRILDKYLWKLQWANQSYALYRATDEEWLGSEFYERPDGMGAWTLAAAAAFQLLTQIITTPEPGDYVLYELSDGSDAYLNDYWYEPDFSIDAYEGRALETTWDWDQGYYWFDSLEQVGYFYDKTIALQLLVDPETAFVGVDTASDVRTYSLSFYNTFGPAMDALFGGLMASDWSTIAPRMGRDGTLTYPTPEEIVSGIDDDPIDPNAHFTIQLYAAAFSMAMIPQSFDHDYLNRSRLFVRGGAEEVEISPPPGCEDCDPADYIVEFHDPFSDLTYVAASYPGEDGNETGIAARMLLHAQTLADRAEESADPDEAAYIEWELGQYIDTMDMMRTLTWELGFGF
jgi:hypothetical protein